MTKITALGRYEMQEHGLGCIARNGGFQFSDTFFPYTSGQIGPYYVQSIVVEKNGRNYAEVIDSMKRLIESKLMPGDFSVISGGESRDWDFSNPVAYALEKDHLKIYKNGKVLGADVDGKNVVHVADLSNKGSSPRDLWIPKIRELGGKVDYIFFFVDRMEDGVQVMEELNLHSEAVVSLDKHAWECLKEWGDIGEKVYHSLRKRGSTPEERKVWAERMLRSDKGFKTLTELIRTSYDKAKKILDKGYPHLKDELVDRLRKKGVDF